MEYDGDNDSRGLVQTGAGEHDTSIMKTPTVNW